MDKSIKAIPGVYTVYWFDGNIEKWYEELSIYKDKYKPQFLEVGCYEGRATVWLLKNILLGDEARITVVDTFLGGEDQGEFSSNIMNGKLYESFLSNTKPWKEKVKILKGESQTILQSMRRGFYDFIYIDASHVAEDVYNDARLAWPLLKKNGLMFFDDFSWTWNYIKDHNRNPEVDDPRHGIEKFLKEIEENYTETYRLHQLHIRKNKTYLHPKKQENA